MPIDGIATHRRGDQLAAADIKGLFVDGMDVYGHGRDRQRVMQTLYELLGIDQCRLGNGIKQIKFKGGELEGLAAELRRFVLIV